MTEEKDKSETTEDTEQVDAETTEAKEEVDAETEEETEEEAKHNDNEIDYDAEIDKERKGKPDPEKAKIAFKERQAKKEDDEESEEDKPLTRKELNSILEADRKERIVDTALQVAKSMTGSEKEAQLIVEKWKNRSFPAHLSLNEQITEMYGAVHAKKLIGERNEALRALRGKDGVNRDAASTHHDAPLASEPKLSAQDKAAVTAVGYSFNAKTRRYEKKLRNGSTLIWDIKTKKTVLVKAS